MCVCVNVCVSVCECLVLFVQFVWPRGLVERLSINKNRLSDFSIYLAKTDKLFSINASIQILA